MNRPIKPLKSTSLSTQVYENLLLKLQNGELDPDERLVDLDIATELGVSRMPVREALLRLQNEEYLVGSSRGFRLPELNTQDMREIFEIRLLLEPQAAKAATNLLSQAQIQLLTTCHTDSLTAHANNDVKAFISANSEFRRIWLDSAPNQRLVKIIKQFSDHVQTVRYKTLQTENIRLVVIDSLRLLLVSFEKRDALGAMLAMKYHLEKAQEIFFNILENYGDNNDQS